MMESHERKPRQQSGAWIILQFTIMVALLVAAPLRRAPWPGRAAPRIGAFLALLGAWVGVAGVRALGPYRTPALEPKPDAPLVTTGIYSHLRHPLYASVIALGFAWALLWRSRPALVLALVQVALFRAKARREEALLRLLFPDYPSYERNVPRFVPRPLKNRAPNSCRPRATTN